MNNNYNQFDYRPNQITPVVKWLLIFNIGIFILYQFVPVSTKKLMDMNLTLFPMNFQFFQPWQLVTYMFSHSDIFHILFNMLMLWMVGSMLEYNMGSKKFLLYYMICGIGAGLVIYFTTSSPVIGASGAIFGIMAAVAYFWPNMPILIFGIIPAKIKWFVIGMIIISLLSLNSGDGISHIGHLSGAVIGLIYLQIVYRQYDLKKIFGSSNRRGY